MMTSKTLSIIILALLFIGAFLIAPAVFTFSYVMVARLMDAHWFWEGVLGIFGFICGLCFPALAICIMMDFADNPKESIIVAIYDIVQGRQKKYLESKTKTQLIQEIKQEQEEQSELVSQWINS
jgi:hypothetical protein